MIQLTGFHAIEEALRSAKRGEGRLRISGKGPRIKKIEEIAAKRGIPVLRVSKAELTALVGQDHRGIAFEASLDRRELTLEGFLAEFNAENGLVLLLDGVTDPHNLGAILRSADQFEADLVCLPERRSAPETAVVANSSAGAVHHVPQVRLPNLSRAAELLKQHEFWIYAAVMGGAPINSLDLTGRTAVVLGSEGSGVSANLLRHSDAEIAIPTRGRVDSLNVSVAAGVILYEVRRQQGW